MTISFSLFESLTLTEQEKERRVRAAYWKQRFYDPMVMMRWVAETRVYPGSRESGLSGVRIYPSGIEERFYP